jgi:DNA-3-methyladenine glycosylase
MFGPAGIAYVYPIHAKYCFNVVTEGKGLPSAVLIRAVEPVEGIESMAIRRKTDDIRKLASGPSRLCQAFEIGMDCNGIKLFARRRIWFEADSMHVVGCSVRTTPRIGVTSAKSKRLRFVAVGNPFASGPKRMR